MKKIVYTGMLSLIIAGMSVSQAFSDVSDKHWAKDSIDKMVEQGIISGHTDGTFKPSVNLKKIESIILLSKAAGVNKYEKATEEFIEEYKDVLEKYKVSQGNKKFVAYLLGIKVLNETELENYISTKNVNSAITREEIAILVTRIIGKEKEATSESLISMPFDDISSISAEAKPYVQYLYDEGIMKGVTAQTFCPKDSVTRAQAAVILNSIVSKIDIVPETKKDIVDNTQANVTLTKGEITDIDTSLLTIEIDSDDIYEYDDNTKIYIAGEIAEIEDVKVDMVITKATIVEGVFGILELNGDSEVNDDKEEVDNSQEETNDSQDEDTITGEIVKIDSSSSKEITILVNKKEKTYEVVASTKFYQAGEKVTIYDFKKGEEVTLKVDGDEIIEMYYASEIETEEEKISYKTGTVVKATSKKLTVKLENGKEEIIYLATGGKIINAETIKEIKLKDIEKGKNVVIVGKYEEEEFYASIISVY